MKKPSAFSLVEISLVILAIGLLIAGITEGKNIVDQARLRAARIQTAQSPVSEINNLIAWWETTSEKSFDNGAAIDGAQIATWRDINPKSLVALNMTQSNNANKPLYKTNVERGLPMLQFVSGGNYFNIPNGTVPYGNSSYTVFIVVKPASCSGTCNILASGNASSNELNSFQYSSSAVKNSWNSSELSANSVNNSLHIYSFTYNNSAGRTIYIDGTSSASDASNSRNSANTSNYLGSNSSANGLDGYLGEVIIFERALKSEERKSVEKYLGRKWGITLN
jgi:hypothetical protein